MFPQSLAFLGALVVIVGLCSHRVISDCSNAPEVSWQSCGPYHTHLAALGNNGTNITEVQLRDACRAIRQAVTCQLQAEYTHMCRREDSRQFLPMFDKYIAVATEWDLCEQPDLYKNYHTVLPCVKSVEVLIELVHGETDPTAVALRHCFIPFEKMYEQSFQKEIRHRNQSSNATTAFDNHWDNMCRSARDITRCGTAALRNGTCSAEAIAVVEKMSRSFTKAFNCTISAPEKVVHTVETVHGWIKDW